MVRPRRGNASRASRNSGKVSGVTYVTDPSGTTITGPDITTAISKSASFRTVSAGVTITSSAVSRNYGYMPQFVTNDLVVATGTTNVTGQAVSQQFTGISTILSVFGQINMKTSGVTGLVLNVSDGQPLDTEWPTAGVTQVCFYVLDFHGAKSGSAASVHYIAIGTG